MKRSSLPPDKLIKAPKLVIERECDELPEDAISDHGELMRTELTGVLLPGTEARSMLFDQVQFTRVDLSRSRLPTIEMIDAKLDACDLAGAEWERGRFTRVEMNGCRLVGAKFFDATIDDLMVRESNCELAIFWSARFRRVRFERSMLRRASFEGADLSGVVFRGCDLTGADFRNAKLVGTDFRGSDITGLQVGIGDLKGAIIDPPQAMELATLLGVTISSTPEE